MKSKAEETVANVFELLREIWKKGNKFGRLGVFFMVGWFVLLVSFAAFPVSILVKTIVFVPVIGAVAFVAAYPVISGIVVAEPHTRKAVQYIFTVLGVQTLVGMYFSVIPVSNNPNLIPTLIAAAIAYIFLSLGAVKGSGIRWIKFILIASMIAITFIFLSAPLSQAAEFIAGEKVRNGANAVVGIAQTVVDKINSNSWLIFKWGLLAGIIWIIMKVVSFVRVDTGMRPR